MPAGIRHASACKLSVVVTTRHGCRQTAPAANTKQLNASRMNLMYMESLLCQQALSTISPSVQRISVRAYIQIGLGMQTSIFEQEVISQCQQQKLACPRESAG